MKPNTVYSIEHLTFSYPEQAKAVLTDLTLSITPGQFVTLCGPSGCGKSTLLRQLKTVLSPHGIREGQILFEGQPLSNLDQRQQSAKIGFVMQSPENQIVTDKVWHELAFGLESLGLDTATIRGRVAEMASFFGIEGWFYKNVTELSGGQKQLLNLASIMAMQPSVLILDEPTSQLDPIAASDFLATIGKINRELGTTIIMTEHRLEEVFPLSDRVLVMDHGEILCDGTPHEVGAVLKKAHHAMFLAMPTPMRVYTAVPNELECPITVRDGRTWLDGFCQDHPLQTLPSTDIPTPGADLAMELDGLWFKYEKDSPDVVKGLSLSINRGEFFAILGGNGTGKSTTLSLMAGLQQPYRGAVSAHGSVGVLPQNPQSLFVKKTVLEDLEEILKDKHYSKELQQGKIAYVIALCRLEGLTSRHPYDLSGGEQQRVALAKILLLDPEILLLDEPTKGLDAEFKQVFAVILQTLRKRGITIIMVSHDIEFCAEYAHKCGLFFDGNLVTVGEPRDFFSGNSFYTTSANRMARHVLPQAVTVNDVITACGGTVPPKPELPTDDDLPPPPTVPKNSSGAATGKLPLWRKVLAGLSGIVVLLTFWQSVVQAVSFNMENPSPGTYFMLIGALLVLILSVSRRSDRPISAPRSDRAKRNLSKRTIAAAILILLLIPLTIYLGSFYLGGRKYYFISLLILLETMLPFFLIFEGRKPQVRELIIISVLCALGVAGRAAFFMLPQFKPVMAIVIIAAVAFGGETGFLVGAVTMLVSNMMAGQGPWSPWQMFAMGIIGFLAGVLFRKGLLRRTRLSLSVFGGLCAVIIYGGIMNPASAILWQGTIEWKVLLTYYVTGFPMDLVHGAATAFFLWFLSQPMLEKLDRIKVKYGLVE